jgi:hypothetical protein
MARRGRELHAEPLNVVDRIVERVDFELAAVARAGIDLPNGDRAAEQAPSARGERAAELLEPAFVGVGTPDRHRTREQRLQQQRAHG